MSTGATTNVGVNNKIDSSIKGALRMPNSVKGSTNAGTVIKIPGLDGATFTPTVDDLGNLSWTNDLGLENPPSVNILGPKGDPGDSSISPEELKKAIGIVDLYVCSDGEYATDGSPTIDKPDENIAYMVPQDNEGILYASWVYADGAWKFVEMLTVTFEETEIDKAELIKDIIKALPVYNGEVVAV